MPSSSVAASRTAHPKTSTLSRLLGPMFGFFVWAGHLLVVYGATAIACVLGLGAGSPDHRLAFLTALGLVTGAAAAVTLVHALLDYRQWRDAPDRRFRTAVTVGCDVIATVAIAWQLIPIVLVPVCA